MMLKQLREKNSARNDLYPGASQIDSAFRGVEFAGEAGELCNILKKIIRGERGIKGNVFDNKIYMEALAAEMGDVLICLDLLAMTLDIDLEEATREAFNNKSDKLGIKVYLEKE